MNPTKPNPTWRAALVCLALGLAPFPAANAAESAIKAVQWEPVDIKFEASRDHPWWTFPARATFAHGESQTALRIDAFWAGGRKWTFRFAPPRPGEWTYTTRSDDPGLDGHRGALDVRAPSAEEIEANPNYRGHLKISENGRYFEYNDGTPFFLLAGTLWAGNTVRCGLGENGNGPFFQYLLDRREKGFTAVLMQLFHGFGDYGYGRFPESPGQRNEGGRPFIDGVVTNLNPRYFEYLDKRMRAVWELGLVAATPTAWFGKTADCKFGIEDAIRAGSHLRTRYGAYNGLWALCGEYQYTFRDCGWTAGDIDRFGRETQQRNPYNHPLSIHPSSQTAWPAPHNVQSSKPFHDSDWLDHHWLQTGQSVNRLHNIVSRAAENRALTPPKPVFCSEGYYERAEDPQSGYHTRWQAWTAYLNGCAGFGHGAMGIWNFFDPEAPGGETGKQLGVPWQTAMQFPGPYSLRHAAAFFGQIEWWKLEPARDALRVDGEACPAPSAEDISPPHAATVPGKLWAVYIPRGNAGREIAVRKGGLAGAFDGRWYNPRTGEYADGDFRIEPGSEILPPRPAPADEDWTALLERR